MTNNSIEAKGAQELAELLAGHGIVSLPMQLTEVGGKWTKKPLVKHAKYRHQMPTIDDYGNWFSKHSGIAVITGGEVGLEVLDFEDRNSFRQWQRESARLFDFYTQLMVVESVSGGYHVWYCCPGAYRYNNSKEKWELSGRKPGALAWDHGRRLLVETRTEGQLCCAPPTPGYQPVQNGWDLEQMTITLEQRQKLLESCQAIGASSSDIKAGDWYNDQDNFKTVLNGAGWSLVKEDEGVEYWRRPGKEDGVSATFSRKDNRGDAKAGTFYVFSSNADPLPQGSHWPFHIYTLYEHGGDYRQAAKQIALSQPGRTKSKPAVVEAEPHSLWETEHLVFPEVKWLIEGLLPQGLAILGGRPKSGKSLLAMNIALGVVSGGRVLNRQCAQGDVLYLAYEDAHDLFVDRAKQIKEAMRMRGFFNADNKSSFDYYVSGEVEKANDGGVRKIHSWLVRHPNAGLIVIDTLGLFKDQTRAGDMEAEYKAINAIQKMAIEHKVCILLIHHTNKQLSSTTGEQQLAGTTGIAAAPDTIMVMNKDLGGNFTKLESKGRRTPEEEMAITLDKETLLWIYSGEVEDMRTGEQKKSVLELLSVYEGEMSPQEIFRELGDIYPSQAALRKALKRFLADGVITKAGWGRYKISDYGASLLARLNTEGEPAVEVPEYAKVKDESVKDLEPVSLDGMELSSDEELWLEAIKVSGGELNRSSSLEEVARLLKETNDYHRDYPELSDEGLADRVEILKQLVGY